MFIEFIETRIREGSAQMAGFTETAMVSGLAFAFAIIGQFSGILNRVTPGDKRAPLELNPVNVDDFDDSLVD